MKIFFAYLKQVRTIYRNIIFYYCTLYDPTDIVKKNTFFNYIKLLITYIFKGLFNEFRFNVKTITNSDDNNGIEIYNDIISYILEINGFEILDIVLYYDTLIYTIKLYLD